MVFIADRHGILVKEGRLPNLEDSPRVTADTDINSLTESVKINTNL